MTVRRWIALALCFAAPAYATSEDVGSFTTGNDLWAACSWPTKDAGAEATCMSYVIGAIDATASLHQETFCIPPHITKQQATDIVKQWLKDTPAERHYTAAYAVRVSFEKAFPCAPKHQ